ncbi:hypothetical protein RhiJN_24312 [Ceratobasidium sp. AG-Ba]|nr:hypothetical protein RhiJN_24312 [Ceratobasidium sp. AG-Ba]
MITTTPKSSVLLPQPYTSSSLAMVPPETMDQEDSTVDEPRKESVSSSAHRIKSTGDFAPQRVKYSRMTDLVGRNETVQDTSDAEELSDDEEDEDIDGEEWDNFAGEEWDVIAGDREYMASVPEEALAIMTLCYVVPKSPETQNLHNMIQEYQGHTSTPQSDSMRTDKAILILSDHLAL